MKHQTSRRTFLQQSLTAVGGVALSASAIPPALCGSTPQMNTYDVVVYGGTSGAVTAAIQARRMGKSVVIVCPETHLGGLTTSGLGWTDSKNGNAIGGVAREFYHRIWRHYQNADVWTRRTRESYLARRISAQPGPAIDESKEVMWTFEPHAAEAVIETWLAEEKIPVFRNEWLDRKPGGVIKQGATVVSFRTQSGKQFAGKMFIDAGYEGDLMAAAGIRYRVGRDSKHEFDEPLNGIRVMLKGVDRYFSADEYPGVDPYVVPGTRVSGLIRGIESELKGPLAIGEADPKRLQCFNYRLCLTQQTENRVVFARPTGYDDHHYELLFRLIAGGATSTFTTQEMPNLKTDSNASGRVSGDFIGGSFSAEQGWTYGDASYDRRSEAVTAHRQYQQGLLWTLQNHPRVPSKTRDSLSRWGLAKDEFVDNDNWPYQLYIREARRMEGMSTVTQHHVQRRPGFDVKDSIGLGSYSLDSHVVRRVVLDGQIRDEGGFYVYWDKPYPLPYGCIVPQKRDATNLFAPLTLSATHAAFGSIRMEPTYMLLGHAAATAAALAIDTGADIQDVSYSALAKRLAADGQILSAHA